MTFQGLGKINFMLQHFCEVTCCGLHGWKRGASVHPELLQDAVTTLQTKCNIKMETLEKPTLPDDLFDVYSFYSQQLL